MKNDRVATFGVLDIKLQLKVKWREERQAAAAARQSCCEKELEEMTAMSSLESESDGKSEEDTNTVYLPSEAPEPARTAAGEREAMLAVVIISREDVERSPGGQRVVVVVVGGCDLTSPIRARVEHAEASYGLTAHQCTTQHPGQTQSRSPA
ncbi:hypothetical protein DPEC_G00046370 [Dallia pectoralis]|uniref:Uncharacterized protein n=1 Tax=Dallia pectoralis TaxID=75939 RepID=A0ACC2H9Z0_DALPE|nr:hypothetical protein DPEC_G00046370 [Dallia pectoralis]